MNIQTEHRLIWHNLEQEKFPDVIEAKEQLEDQTLDSPEDVKQAAKNIIEKSLRWVRLLDPSVEKSLKNVAISGSKEELTQSIDAILEGEVQDDSGSEHAREDLHLKIPELKEAINNVGKIFSTAENRTLTSGIIIDGKGAILMSESRIPKSEDGKNYDFSNLELILQDGTEVDLNNSTVLSRLDGFIAIQPEKFTRFINKHHLEFTTNYQSTDSYYLLIPGKGARQVSHEELRDGVELSRFDKVERLNPHADTQEERDSRLGSYPIVNQRGELVTMTNPNVTASNAKQGEAYTANEQTIQTIYRSVRPAI